MEIKVNVPDELSAQARARGLQPEAYVEEILARQAAVQPAVTRQARTAEEVRAWLDSVAQFSEKIPPLPETISREWIYQDHN
jgi:post-segregation antitoxin (ccd killing protein)